MLKKRVVAALGGNALLRRGEELSIEAQRQNARTAIRVVARMAERHNVVLTHGNGPQVGLLALQEAAWDRDHASFPLDVLGAETQGMIGYILGQELRNQLSSREVATLLTQVRVDPHDPAFARPTKPIGPFYGEEEARRMAEGRGWKVAPEGGEAWRRVVPSPRPEAILEIDIIRALLERDVVVVCAGGGGIPVTMNGKGRLAGVEAVIDKDRTSALLAEAVGADALLLLTDVAGVYRGWGTDDQELLDTISRHELHELSLAEGSMGPKVEAAADFVAATGGMAAIGCLDDAEAILAGERGTRVVG